MALFDIEALLTKVRTAGISGNLTFPSSATGGGQVRFCRRQRSSLFLPQAAVGSIAPFKIGVIHRKKLESLVFHGISSSLHLPQAAVGLNNSVQNRRDSSQKARITSFSRNFALPSSATGGGRAQFILD